VQSDSLARRFNELAPRLRELVHRELASWLLAASHDWRDRVVETIVPLDADYYADRVSLQFTVRPRDVQSVFDVVGTAILPRVLPDSSLLAEFRNAFPAPKAEPSWQGQPLRCPVPLFTFPKRLLLNPETYDGHGHRVTLLTRERNAVLLASHLSGILRSVGGGVLGHFSHRVTDVLHTLAFSIPDGILTPDGGPLAALPGGVDLTTSDIDQAASDLMDYIGLGLSIGEAAALKRRLTRDVIAHLLREGLALAPSMERYRWTAASGLREPLLNPLLLLPDQIKIQRQALGDAFDVIGEVTRYMSQGHVLLRRILPSLLATARQRGTSSDQAGELRAALADGVLADLARFSHVWVAYADLEVRLGEPMLIKFAQITPLSRRAGALGVLRGVTPLRVASRVAISRVKLAIPGFGIAHRYDLRVGDAAATHVDVASPDSSAVRIVGARTRVEFGRAFKLKRSKVRALFGITQVGEERISLYTTKTRDELGILVERLEEANQRKLRGAAARELPRLRVVYKLQRGIAALYVLLCTFSVVSAWAVARDWQLWKRLPPTSFLYRDDWSAIPLAGRLSSLIDALPPPPTSNSFLIQSSLVALVALVAGVVAIRERANVTSRLVLRARWILFGSLTVLLVSFVRTLLIGRF
jgi:hypothetical protein